MRLIPVILVAAIVGAGLGAAAAFVGQPTVEKRFAPPLLDASASAPTEESVQGAAPGLPKAEVDEVTHDFGTMQRGAMGSHEFTITNTGDAPLLLDVGPTSCKCTLGEVADGPLSPGGVDPGPGRVGRQDRRRSVRTDRHGAHEERPAPPADRVQGVRLRGRRVRWSARRTSTSASSPRRIGAPRRSTWRRSRRSRCRRRCGWRTGRGTPTFTSYRLRRRRSTRSQSPAPRLAPGST